MNNKPTGSFFGCPTFTSILPLVSGTFCESSPTSSAEIKFMERGANLEDFVPKGRRNKSQKI
uniref:Uncharacterized protein n=1 Tax=Romanomermis culicivorax TaxID=13658 RepID=A0A915L7D9_ROMCU